MVVPSKQKTRLGCSVSSKYSDKFASEVSWQRVDPVTGYRYYHIIQSAKLDLIQNMKVYGMTLRQIWPTRSCPVRICGVKIWAPLPD